MKPAPFEYHAPDDRRRRREAPRRARRRREGARGRPEPRADAGVAARGLRAPRRRRAHRRAEGHRAPRRCALDRRRHDAGGGRGERRRSRPPCRCSPGRRRSSATSRSATAARSAARSRTPIRPPSTRPSRSRSTRPWRSSRSKGRRTIAASRLLRRSLDARRWRRTSSSSACRSRSGAGGAASRFEELARRHGDFAIAGAAIGIELDEGDADPTLRDRPDRPRLDARAGARDGVRARGQTIRRRRGGSDRPPGGRRPRLGARATCTAPPTTGSAWARRWSRAPGPRHSRRRAMREVTVHVTVNGQAREATVEPRLTLADFLRERAAGSPARTSAASTASAAPARCSSTAPPCARASSSRCRPSGAEVTTVEGIASPDGELSPVQAAFRDCHGLQCGFCTPGLRRVGDGVPPRPPRPDRRRDPRGRSPATSAAAPATRASSKRSVRLPARFAERSRDERRSHPPLRRWTRPSRRGRPAAHRHGHLRRRHLAPGHAARLLRPQPLSPSGDPGHRHVGGAGASGCPLRLHRRRPQSRRP